MKQTAGVETCPQGYKKIEDKEQCIYAGDVIDGDYVEKGQETGVCWFDEAKKSLQYGVKTSLTANEHLICVGN